LNYRFFGNDASCTLQLVRDELDKFSDYEIHCAAIHMIEENPKRKVHLERYLLMECDLFCSPKFVRLRTILPELISKGHRILIFSQWTKILDLMGHLLQALHMDNYLHLDGQTAVSKRQELIDKFTNDSSIPFFCFPQELGGWVSDFICCKWHFSLCIFYFVILQALHVRNFQKHRLELDGCRRLHSTRS